MFLLSPGTKLKPDTMRRLSRGILKYFGGKSGHIAETLIATMPKGSIDLIWASPECVMHGPAKYSKAKGGKREN